MDALPKELLLSWGDLLSYALTPHHYFAYLILFLAWITLFLLSYASRNIRILNIITPIFIIVFLFTSPYFLHQFIKDNILKISLLDTQTKQLGYSQKVALFGTIQNRSKHTYLKCRIDVYAISKKNNIIQNLREKILHTRSKIQHINSDLEKFSKETFYITIENIKNSEKFDFNLNIECK
jgi:hypothetical protein